jgi:hypothetical protein
VKLIADEVELPSRAVAGAIDVSERDFAVIVAALRSRAETYEAARKECYNGDGTFRAPGPFIHDWQMMAVFMADMENEARELIARLCETEPPPRVEVDMTAPVARPETTATGKHARKRPDRRAFKAGAARSSDES